MSNTFREALDRGEFVVTCEAIPGRGAFEIEQEKAMEEALELGGVPGVHAVSVTDNPGGNPALLADQFVKELLDKGLTPLLHFTCKDRNRNQMLSQLYALQRAGIENLLVMTGDYPVSGWKGASRPVFDLDSVTLTEMLQEMNDGLVYSTFKGERTEKKSNFFVGVVTNPFKWTEAEVLPQYFKLKKKIIAGGSFIISQLGYNARKMEELIFYLKDNNLDVPAIANIFVMTAPIARAMNKGSFPGCFVSDELLAEIEEEAKAEDKGRAARLTRAAKMVALAKGMGYAGVHIGGFGLSAEAVKSILDQAKGFEADWKAISREFYFKMPGTFYIYKEDEATGLNTHELAPLNELAKGDRSVYKRNRISRIFHNLTLEKGAGGYNILKSRNDRKENKKGKNFHHGIEHLSKTILYGCMDCGDCGLDTIAYQCPMTQCPKSQRNGPCGGGDNTWCEVYPNHQHCVYYNAYNRWKKFGEQNRLGDKIVPPNHWEYLRTSAWSNYTHDRDNAVDREMLEEKGK